MFRHFFLTALLVLSASSVWAAELLRVAFYPLEGFFEYDEHGKESGYGVEYLNKIAQYTGYTFQYVKVDSWEKTWDMLVNGDVDLRMPVEIGGPRAPTSTISADPILRTFYVVLALNAREDLNYNDFEQLRHIRLAISERLWRHEDIEKEFSALGLDKNLVVFPEYNACRTALDRGDVDGIITNVMDMTADTKMLARFKVVPTHITMRKSDSRMAIISDAVTNIKLTEPYFEPEIYKKYFPNRAAIPYTKDEKAFIRNTPRVTVAVFADRKPMSFWDRETGKMQGIAIDLLRLLEQKAGLSFAFVPIPAGITPLEMLKDPSVDLTMPIVEQAHPNSEFRLNLTDPLLRLPLVFAARKGRTLTENDVVTIATLRDNRGLIQKALDAFPHATFTFYSSLSACLAAVRAGSADLCLHTLYPLDYELQRPQNRNMTAVPPLTRDTDYCLAGRPTHPLELFSIIRKGMERITPEEREAIIRSSLAHNRFVPTLSDRIYENAWPLGVAVGLLCLLLLWGLSRMRTLQRLERANTAKSQFLSRMSHDIRTPMNAVLGLVGLTLELPDLPKEAKQNLEDVIHSSEYLLGLINDVLDMSKIESGKVAIRPVPILYGTFCASILPPLQAVARSKGVDLSWGQTVETPVPLMLDRQHYSQILVNLISNAIKFTPKGGRIRMELSKIRQSATELECRFSVSDTGIGINPAFLPHIYEPFRQEDSTKTGELKGTGLGLSIVKHLVELMGGTLSVTSEPGKGTTFVIHTTLRFATPADLAAQTPEPCAAMPVENRLAGKRILLAEDHPMNVLVAKKMLEKQGVSIEHAANGREAVDKIVAMPEGYFDAVLMDIRMPVMDGLAAARAIRTLDRPDARHIPIIAMTANAFDEDRKACLDAGMNAYLTKPIVSRDLYAVLLRQTPSR